VLKEKIWANFQRIIELFTQKIVTKLSKIWVWNPGSGIRKKPIPDPRSRGQKGTESATLLYSTVYDAVYHLVESELERDERLGLHTLARLVHDADRNAAELILRTTWQRRSSARLQEMVPHLLKEKINLKQDFMLVFTYCKYGLTK
jgi:hypothetical protein